MTMLVSRSQSKMMEQGICKTYQEAFEVSNGGIQGEDSNSFDDDGRPKITGNQISSEVEVFVLIFGK